MNVHTIEKKIRESVKVERHMVAAAKGFLLNYEGHLIDLSEASQKFLRDVGYEKPQEILIHGTVPLEPQIKQAIGYYSYLHALVEAVWDLIHDGEFLVDEATNRFGLDVGLAWTDIIPGHGGTRSSWRFPELRVYAPTKIKRRLSRINEDNKYSYTILLPLEKGIDSAHKEVNEAIQDTLSCFKNELFRPAVTMLGKVVEGAWIELGLELLKLVPKENQDRLNVTKLEEELKGNNVGIAYKVNKVINLYTDYHKYFRELAKETRVRVDTLKRIKLWTDVVLDSRNAIHFDAVPAIENTYEKVSILLMSTPEYLETMYRLKEAAYQKAIIKWL